MELTEEQLILIEIREKAKGELKEIDKMYEEHVTEPFKEWARKECYERNIATLELRLPSGDKLVYKRPRKYYRLRSAYTMEMIRYEIPQYTEEAEGYESVTLVKNRG